MAVIESIAIRQEEMTRYVAFLRGVNLGKRTVKSAELKAAFEAMGFENVKTLLASGNVLFDARAGKGLKDQIEAEPKALALFETLNAQNRFSLAFRTHNMKTPAGRARKIAGFVEMLKRGETIYPNGKKK